MQLSKTIMRSMKTKSIQSHACQVYFRHACEVEIFTALSEDEYYISFAKVADDIVKVKGDLSIKSIEDWLRGCSLKIEMYTDKICKLCLPSSIDQYKEEYYEVDDLYWKTLAKIVYDNRTDYHPVTMGDVDGKVFNYNSLIFYRKNYSTNGNPYYKLKNFRGERILLKDGSGFNKNLVPFYLL